ncbi:hypothetical protein SGPA1_22056 [Streptomyces misionensis JCM 4497]
MARLISAKPHHHPFQGGFHGFATSRQFGWIPGVSRRLAKSIAALRMSMPVQHCGWPGHLVGFRGSTSRCPSAAV